ncbi:DegT/DnrJ/EryC1/StrS aminotransferase [Elusimicrobium minutum Pei191]|uniref:DegT/DnrJ/EryC1/StrS aminotransferase n=1 Tax=Elusimicrobium minutum (strain Pei191) TaxID=445932 RepID=B2KD22_ELUMP|nr:DegT/DnrJ/EryC1/StrS family aminotransferase [Elusimicrobium minutum]ACC98418.1 DegT/DnrJ/EryC1/StrS aminotransferase [Elusimicrobium minutum Pei191]
MAQKNIPLFIPTFRTEECLEQIRECLDKGWTGLGFKTVELEEKWKEYTKLPHAHFLASATAGLDLAFNILKEENNWQDGDEVITTPMTFVSSNHAILYNRLKPVFADVDEYLCLDPKSVVERITPKTKAVLFVGIGGNAGRYAEVEKICKEKGLALVLDAAHMAGTKLNGDVPGRGADAVVYSYQAVKNMPTGDSGMICFKEAKFDEIVRKKSWLGINKDTFARTAGKGAYKWKYDVEYVGFKDHGNSIMAGIGLVSLKYLDQDNNYRRQIAAWYDEEFKNSGVKTVPVAPGCESSRHLYQILIGNRDELLAALNENGVYPGVHYRDNTEYRMYAYAKGTCPNSHYVSEHTLSLPMHMKLTREDVKYVADTVKKYAK